MADRILHDTLGEVKVSDSVLFGAQTQRAKENFHISGYRFPREFLHALALIKGAAAHENGRLGMLTPEVAEAVIVGAHAVEQGKHDADFPLDVFQTGSGTSTNMNANEVIATLASYRLGSPVHPNDHVNLGQSSNDVIPTAIHISAARQVFLHLLPILNALAATIADRAKELDGVVKTGRTHLMDAVPMRMSQELSAWEQQSRNATERVKRAAEEMLELAIGGTAIGTGLNTHADFGRRVAAEIAARTGLPFRASHNPFALIASQDIALNLSAALRGTAVVLQKIANDLRWMNSGPVSGLAEIQLPALQPGSSIMPGKVNPVIPEAVLMACAQVIGYDAAIAAGAQAGNFQLNTMLPLIAWNLLESIRILSNAAEVLNKKCLSTFVVNKDRLRDLAARNPILTTALNLRIGYEASARIAHIAADSGRSVLDVAREETELSEEELRSLLDPAEMAGKSLRSGKFDVVEEASRESFPASDSPAY